MKLLIDGTLPDIDTIFKCSPFEVQIWHNQNELNRFIKNSDVLVCRATLQINQKLLETSQVKYVATATSGIDHLDINYLKSRNIQWFDAKGANANAVADYIISTLAYLRIHAILNGNLVGIIGFGEVGSRVYHRLKAIGYECRVFDPFKPKSSDAFVDSIEPLKSCDLILVHANYHDKQPHPSKDLINQTFLNQLKQGTVIVNASRGGIVNESDLLLKIPNLVYCTDVYENEPNISKQIIESSTICTPHIAGHTIEAKRRALHVIKTKILRTAGFKYSSNSLKFDTVKRLFFGNSWEKKVLSLYDPSIETNTMKKLLPNQDEFTLLRSQHSNRHEFCTYDDSMLTNIEKTILGIKC